MSCYFISYLIVNFVFFSLIVGIFNSVCRSLFGTYRGAFTTGRFIMFSVIINIYNNKTKGPTLMELFKATEKLEKFFFYN
jgi:hypothetical protein